MFVLLTNASPVNNIYDFICYFQDKFCCTCLLHFWAYLASCTLYRVDTSSFAESETAATRVGTEERARVNNDKPETDLVYARNAICDDFWMSWPAVQNRAIAHGTVVVFDVFASVGNLFLTLNVLMKVYKTVTKYFSGDPITLVGQSVLF